MEIAKLEIFVETSANPLTFDKTNPIKALFNPNQLSIVKAVNWASEEAHQLDVPAAQFTHGDPATLTVDLFFDTFAAQTDVRKDYTDRITQLTLVKGDLHRPPICQLSWGKQGDFFQGVLQNLTQRFTLFLADGKPARATLTCIFREWRSSAQQDQEQDRRSADVAKMHVVKRGDTLSSIASEQYGDPALWRSIAAANRIDDARRLPPGQILAIPPLRPGSGLQK